MGVVHHLDEGFYFLPPRKLLRPHAPGHFPGIPLDASNDSMRIWALFSTIIGLLYDDDLFASLTALEDDSNFSGLVDFDHLDNLEYPLAGTDIVDVGQKESKSHQTKI